MGCSYDVFTGKLKQTEYNQDFVDLWNSVLENELYDDWAKMSLDNFEIDENGDNSFGIDAEPLFCTMEAGDQVEEFLIEFFRKHPDAEFEGMYECTYNNCGDMNLKFITYKDGVIYVRARHSEAPYIEECPECGCDDDGDELFSMHDWDPDKPFVCPECGCEMEMDVFVDEYEIDVKSGKYSCEDDKEIVCNDY